MDRHSVKQDAEHTFQAYICTWWEIGLTQRGLKLGFQHPKCGLTVFGYFQAMVIDLFDKIIKLCEDCNHRDCISMSKKFRGEKKVENTISCALLFEEPFLQLQERSGHIRFKAEPMTAAQYTNNKARL